MRNRVSTSYVHGQSWVRMYSPPRPAAPSTSVGPSEPSEPSEPPASSSAVEWNFSGPYSNLLIVNNGTIDNTFLMSEMELVWDTIGETFSVIGNTGETPLTVTGAQISTADFTMTLEMDSLEFPYGRVPVEFPLVLGPGDVFFVLLTAAGVAGTSAVVTITHNGINSPYSVNLHNGVAV